MARSMRPVSGTGTTGPPPNPNPRPGGVPKGRDPLSKGLVTNTGSQNVSGIGGKAGGGKARQQSRVARILTDRQPMGPHRPDPTLVNVPRNGPRGRKTPINA